MGKPILFSFFSGSGFLDLGFEKNGFDVQFVNEIHKPFLNAYIHSRKKLNIEEPLYGYSSQSIENLLFGKESKKFKENFNSANKSNTLIGFIGGPPCPDFSIAGKNRGKDGENGKLSQTYIDGVIKYKPDFFIFENVKGLWRTTKHREFYNQLKSKLQTNGYVLIDRLTNAIEYGVPQDRDRILLFGVRKQLLSKASMEELSNNFSWGIKKKYSIDSVLNFEGWPSTNTYKENSNRKIPKTLNQYKNLTVLHWFHKNNVENHPNSIHHFIPRAGITRFRTVDEGDDSKKSFKRLHRFRYSPTAAYGNNEVHLHPFKSRRISVAEALAIQSMPSKFELPEDMSLTNMFKTIGNGVPYLLSYGLAKSTFNFLKNNTSKG